MGDRELLMSDSRITIQVPYLGRGNHVPTNHTDEANCRGLVSQTL